MVPVLRVRLLQHTAGRLSVRVVCLHEACVPADEAFRADRRTGAEFKLCSVVHSL